MKAPLDWAKDGRDWPLHDASRFVAAGGPEWRVAILGEGPPALLIHGTGASGHSWRDMAPLLAARFTVIAPDLPGHAFTAGRPRGGLSLPGMAAALGALIEALEVNPALVVGHSAGAAIAARMALDGRLRAPILGFGPALRPFPGVGAPLFGGLARILLLNPLAPRIFAHVARRPGETGRFLARSTGSHIDARGVALYERLFSSPAHCQGALEMMARWDGLADVARRLPELPVPLMIAHGANDSSIPLAAARAAAASCAAPLEVLHGLGHLAHEERPGIAAALAQQFFDQHAKDG